MGYFPFFVDVRGWRCLLIGGGQVALRKAEKLLPFEPEITVAAPEILPALASMPGVRVRRQRFSPSMLDEADMVIAAAGDPAVNREAAQLCRERRIPVNAVDDREACSFLFPALIQRGDLSVGVSTGGTSPACAAWTARQIRSVLPGSLDTVLAYMGRIRPQVKNRLPDAEKIRASALESIFLQCLSEGRELEPAELETILAEAERQAADP